MLTFLPYLSDYLKPTEIIAENEPLIISKTIPETFGQWRIDESIIPLEISEELKLKLEKTYDQTLSKTYINDKGYRIMLSIAYGGDQSSDSTQVHRPEFCYTAQGFKVTENKESILHVLGHEIPVTQLIAQQDNRIEPITYWIMIGKNTSLPGFQRKLQQLKYGLSGKIPDGMLIRISSIDTDISKARAVQQEFINQLYSHIDTVQRQRFFGLMSSGK